MHRHGGKPSIIFGGSTMGKLGFLNDWVGKAGGYSAKRNARDYLAGSQVALAAAGSACGAGDDGKKKPEPKPAACGAGDDGKKKPAPKPAACGSACGAGDDGKKKPEPKPSACGVGGR